MNNFQKIKAMDIEEMAKWLYATKNSCNSCVAKYIKCSIKPNCINDIKKWLESESEEVDVKTL